MILTKSPVGTMPPGSVVLTEEEAYTKIMESVNSWKKTNDTLALKWGSFVLAGISFCTLSYYTAYYRRRFKLRQFGRVLTYTSSTLIPPFFCDLFHLEFVRKDIILQKQHELWTGTKAMCYQGFFSVIYGLTTPFVTSMMVAGQCATFNVPPFLVSNTREILKIWATQTQRISSITMVLLGLNLVAAMTVTVLEQVGFERFYDKWLAYQIEREDVLKEFEEKSPPLPTEPSKNK